jgi:hypothetical protein
MGSFQSLTAFPLAGLSLAGSRVAKRLTAPQSPKWLASERVRGQSLVIALLKGEDREQVLAHDPVLKLRGLAEHVHQRLAVLDHERRLRRRRAAV